MTPLHVTVIVGAVRRHRNATETPQNPNRWLQIGGFPSPIPKIHRFEATDLSRRFQRIFSTRDFFHGHRLCRTFCTSSHRGRRAWRAFSLDCVASLAFLAVTTRSHQHFNPLHHEQPSTSSLLRRRRQLLYRRCRRYRRWCRRRRWRHRG